MFRTVWAFLYPVLAMVCRCNSGIDTLSVSKPFFFLFNTENSKLDAPIEVRFRDLKGKFLSFF